MKGDLNKVVDRLFNYCEEIDNHLEDEEKTGYRMLDDINLLKNGINQLETNWKELKKWLEEKDNRGYEKLYLEDILTKMQELESGNNGKMEM